MGMTNEKILEALEKMRAVADDIKRDVGLDGIAAKRIDPHIQLGFVDCQPDPEVLAHILFMLEETADMVRQGRREKAFRWLGFLQGLVWARGWYSLEVLKQMNMPDATEEAPTP